METVDKQKEAFGVALGQFPGDAWKAALSIFGEDTGKALTASQYWINDPIVIKAKNEYIENNGKALNLLSKEELAIKILALADTTTNDFRDRMNGYKLYAELMDFMPKVNNTQINDNRTMNVTNKVMLVPTHSTNDDWESKLLAQQEKLINVSAN